MDFKNNLRKRRFVANISQETLAEKMSVSRQTISKWENGNACPSTSHIFLLAKILNCNINDLISPNIITTKTQSPKTTPNPKHRTYWILTVAATLAITLFLCLASFNAKIYHDSKIDTQKIAIFDQIVNKTLDKAISENGYAKKEIVGYGIDASTDTFYIKCNLEGSASPCSAIFYFCEENGEYKCKCEYLDDPDYLPAGEYYEIS